MRPLASLLTAAKSVADNRRRGGRIRVYGVRTSFGHVLDLSSGGVRLRAGRTVPPAGASLEMSIQTQDGPQVVKARVAWVKKTGFFSHELGLEFVGVSPEARAAITKIAVASATEPEELINRAA
jgi:hypothetical protein